MWRRSRRRCRVKGIGSAAAAATEITLLDPSVTDANSRAFSSITKPLQIPNGSPASAIGSAPVALTTIMLQEKSAKNLFLKRLASEEFVLNWDHKRPSEGQTFGLQQSVPGFDLMLGYNTNSPNSIYPSIPSESSAIPSTLQVSLQVPRVPAAPTLLGKGAKQWHDEDWM